MKNSKLSPPILVTFLLFTLLSFSVLIYEFGIKVEFENFKNLNNQQASQVLTLGKQIISQFADDMDHNTHETQSELLDKIIQSLLFEADESEGRFKFAILNQEGIFLYHPIYNGKDLEFIKLNYDYAIYNTIFNTPEGTIEVPQNQYQPTLQQVIHYTKIEKLNWSLMLIEEQSYFNDFLTFQSNIYILIFSFMFLFSFFIGGLLYIYMKYLIKTQHMNSNLEEIVKDRTIAVLTNNRELEYALKDTEESKEKAIKSNEELNLMIRQIQDTQEKLIESEKMASLGSIVAGVAHEINTPLGTALTSATYLTELIKDLEKDYHLGALTKRTFSSFIDDYKDSCGLLTDSLFRTSELVLSFKQIAVDQSDTQRMSFDLCDYLHKIVLSLKHEYKKTSHSIKIHCSGVVEIDSYPGAFAQIFTNLIMNSLIHGFEGMIEGTVVIDIKKINSNLFIIYSDNGKGISRADIKRIFEPFFTTKRGSGGSGLGMNIVYNLITQKLEGTIQVKSERNNGVKFIIQIPVR